MILFCKDTPVYDIDNNIIYNTRLLPGYMMKNPCRQAFKLWLKLRYSSNTNVLARALKGVVFGQGNRDLIDRTTHILSLSDCYWIKNVEDDICFKDISPYYNKFWRGDSQYKGEPIPTLYVSGCLPKEWKSSKYLYKYGNDLSIELEVSRLCKICNIPVCDIETSDNGILVLNFTSSDLMLEQADQSGMIDTDDLDEHTIIDLFGKFGIQMLVVDAIIGNGDRHAGNFGWLRDTHTGDYVSPAPLYDFDHALDSKLSCDRLIIDTVKAVKYYKYEDEAIRICNLFFNNTKIDVFKLRALSIIDLSRKQNNTL